MSTLTPETLTPAQRGAPHPTWLWPNRIPLGKITLLAGDPGLGKSFIALDIAARLSTGRRMPDSQIENRKSKIENPPGPIGNRQLAIGNPAPTLLLSAEDELHDTILPRLASLHADADLVFPLRCLDSAKAETQPFSLKTHLDFLRRALEVSHAKLIILDPITAFMDGIDLNSTSSIRQHLTPLAQLAAFYGTAILAITHLNKEAHRQSLYRATGSLALAAIARTVHLVHVAPSRKCHLFSPIKSNLASEVEGLRFRIADSTVEWLGPEEATGEPEAQDLFEDHDRQVATDFLMATLAGGPRAAIPLIREAKALAISERTLRRAKAQLGILSKLNGRRGEWYWLFPQQSL